MNARHLAWAVLLVGLGPLSPIRADDPPGTPPPPPPPPASSSAIAVPDPTPYLDAGGARLVGVARDGSMLFFTRPVDGVRQLFMARPDGTRVRQVTDRPQSPSLTVPSPDGISVIVGYDHDGDENVDLELYAPSRERPITGPVASGGDVQRGSVVWAPDGGQFFYRANDGDRASFRIHRATLDHGIRDEVVFEARGSWRVEDVSLGGDRLLLVRERSNREASLFMLHVKSHSLIEIHPNLEGSSGAVDKARFVGDGSKILFTQEYSFKDRDTYRSAWIFDVATGAAAMTPAQGFATRHGCCIVPGDIEEVAATIDGSRVYVRKNVEAPDQIAITDVATNEELAMMKCPAGEYSGLFVDARGRVYSSRTSPSDPGSIVRWDTDISEPKFIMSAELSVLGTAPLPDDPTLVTLFSAGNLDVRAWLWLPKGKEPKKLPFIVSIHGGPEGEDRPGWHADRAYLLSLGFGVLAPNVRGSTGRGRLFRDADDGAKRMDAVRDAKAAADWLVEKGYADPKRLGVMGGSYGGFMVMALLTEFPDRFVAGAEAVGIVNFETFLEKTSSYRRALREAEYGSLSDRDLLRSISPIHKLDRITAALLVAHGENDPRVPVGEARQIEAELKRLGRPVETLIFPDEGHGFRKPANRKAHLEALARFFLTHLAPR